MSKKLIMHDHADRDPRSVSSMLQGCGDGREKIWLKYQASHQDIFDQEYLMEAYTYALRKRLIHIKEKPKPQTLYQRVIILVTVIFIIF